MNDNRTTKFLLNETDLPKAWYNIMADSPRPPTPVLHPKTTEPVTPEFLSALFPMPLIQQEVSADRYIDIPEEVQEIYKLWRPTPLLRARRLEKALGTPAHIYYKNEGVSPPGSHKPNTAVAQAYFNTHGPRRTKENCNRAYQANPFLRVPVRLDEYVKNRDVWSCPSAKLEAGASFILASYGYWLERYMDNEGSWGTGTSAGGPCYVAWPPGWGGAVTDSITQGTHAMSPINQSDDGIAASPTC